MARAPFVGTIPRNFNERIFINFNTGSGETAEWHELCHGILSRGVDISQDTEEYSYLCSEGSSETIVSGQTVTRNYTGHRFLGDTAQDIIFLDKLYDIGDRNVQYIRYYENPPASWATSPARGNGWQGFGTLQISDDGSGDASVRQNIDFSITENGTPTRGTVTVDSDTNIPAFTPLAA